MKKKLSGLAISNCCTVVCISYYAAGFLFTAGIGRPSAIDVLLCTVRDRPSAISLYTQSRWMWIVCMTARLDVTLKTTEQNQIVRTGKSEAEVTNNKKNAWGIVLLKLTTDRHEASRGLFVTAELLVLANLIVWVADIWMDVCRQIFFQIATTISIGFLRMF